MEKTINANVGGRAFTFNESAYYTLKNYLEDIEQRIVEPDKSETMRDIEQRVSELLADSASSGLEVITQTKVLSIMGTIGSSNTFGKSQPGGSNNQVKRLYRNSRNMVIGGVCSGLANYLGIDVLLVRILTFILVFFLGISIWAYLIMWIFVPKSSEA